MEKKNFITQINQFEKFQNNTLDLKSNIINGGRLVYQGTTRDCDNGTTQACYFEYNIFGKFQGTTTVSNTIN